MYTQGNDTLTMDLGPTDVAQATELLAIVRREGRIHAPITTAGLYPQARTLCRRVAGNANLRCDVIVIDGNAPPTLRGRRGYWTTPSGKTEVRHPNAYGWPTWYHASTLHVTVGADWLKGRI